MAGLAKWKVVFSLYQSVSHAPQIETQIETQLGLIVGLGLAWSIKYNSSEIILTAQMANTGLILRFDRSHDSLMENGLPVAALSDIARVVVNQYKGYKANIHYRVLLTYKDGNSKDIQGVFDYNESLDLAKEIADYVGVTVNAPSV